MAFAVRTATVPGTMTAPRSPQYPGSSSAPRRISASSSTSISSSLVGSRLHHLFEFLRSAKGLTQFSHLQPFQGPNKSTRVLEGIRVMPRDRRRSARALYNYKILTMIPSVDHDRPTPLSGWQTLLVFGFMGFPNRHRVHFARGKGSSLAMEMFGRDGSM